MDKTTRKEQFIVPKFPAVNSPQTSSSSSSFSLKSPSNRKKVALKKGCSLMDWIRLGQSGQDLTGVGGKIMDVSEEELAKHDLEKDLWMAIRGKVYNLTPYLDFHPGGIDELMKGAGQDATQLFDEVHRWVNVDSMLAKCYIGQLITEQSSKASISSNRSNSLVMNMIVPPLKHQDSYKPPSYEWSQTESSVIVTIFTQWKKMMTEFLVIQRNEKDLTINAFIRNGDKYQIHVVLEDYITSDYKVKLKEPGTVEVQFKKQDPCVSWTSLGKSEELQNTYLEKIIIEPLQQECQIDSIVQLTHNTKLFRVLLPDGCLMKVPIGYHLRIYHTIGDMEMYRQYTPVLPSLLRERMDSVQNEGRVIYFMIKIYEDGVLTQWLDSLKTGCPLKISSFEGDFEIQKLYNCTHLVMFAAGTGFTPMVKLIYYALTNEECNDREVTLLFFNRTEEDIVWREELDKLSAQFERFCVKYVLSKPSRNWAGSTGHLNEELVQQYLPPLSSLSDQKMLVCACGPTPFTANAMRLARLQGYSDDCLHPFLG